MWTAGAAHTFAAECFGSQEEASKFLKRAERDVLQPRSLSQAKLSGNRAEATCHGSSASSGTYSVAVALSDSTGRVEEASCSCPFFTAPLADSIGRRACKHILGLMLWCADQANCSQSGVVDEPCGSGLPANGQGDGNICPAAVPAPRPVTAEPPGSCPPHQQLLRSSTVPPPPQPAAFTKKRTLPWLSKKPPKEGGAVATVLLPPPASDSKRHRGGGGETSAGTSKTAAPCLSDTPCSDPSRSDRGLAAGGAQVAVRQLSGAPASVGGGARPLGAARALTGRRGRRAASSRTSTRPLRVPLVDGGSEGAALGRCDWELSADEMREVTDKDLMSACRAALSLTKHHEDRPRKQSATVPTSTPARPSDLPAPRAEAHSTECGTSSRTRSPREGSPGSPPPPSVPRAFGSKGPQHANGVPSASAILISTIEQPKPAPPPSTGPHPIPPAGAGRAGGPPGGSRGRNEHQQQVPPPAVEGRAMEHQDSMSMGRSSAGNSGAGGKRPPSSLFSLLSDMCGEAISKGSTLEQQKPARGERQQGATASGHEGLQPRGLLLASAARTTKGVAAPAPASGIAAAGDGKQGDPARTAGVAAAAAKKGSWKHGLDDLL
eukprot:CAMPEP_0117650554 /NCGR_PEP_ID=MMETSP0804-20121206/1601_1 /TAXON_ID=1074897 /ORGANISM="Tetraselmis astigmatica, Strain CCMP880" /LENGTH=606 /DNA_ID=CAMNT_0005456433 /DNA_START=611 /DNA_END=2431 /DNA_ORIENTATION=+